MVAGHVTLALGDVHSLILKRDGSVWSTGATLPALSPLNGVDKVFVKVNVTCTTTMVACDRYNMVLKCTVTSFMALTTIMYR